MDSEKMENTDVGALKEAERKGYERGYGDASKVGKDLLNGEWLPVRRSASTKELDTAMSTIMLKMGKAIKGADNPFFHSTYADLDSVRQTILEAMTAAQVHVLIQQFPVTDYTKCVDKTVVVKNRNGDYVKDIQVSVPFLTVTTRIVEPVSGEWQESDLSCYPAEDTPQAIGSAITYLRRYSLMPIFNIAPADDDGNAASGRDDMNQDTKPPKAQGSSRGARPPAASPEPQKSAQGQTAQLPAQKQPEQPSMTPEQRAAAGLIGAQAFDELTAELKKSGIKGAQWRPWLKDCYGYNSASEIKIEAYPGIKEIVRSKADQIKNYKPKAQEERQPGQD